MAHRLREHLLQRVLVARAGVAEHELGLVLQQRAVVLQLRLICRSVGFLLVWKVWKSSRRCHHNIKTCCTSLFKKAKKSELTKPGLARRTALTCVFDCLIHWSIGILVPTARPDQVRTWEKLICRSTAS